MSLAIFMLVLPMHLPAAQFDAPYYDLAKKNEAKWAKEDQQIEEKLAALKKKFGKRPNIIYILADDVGWGEMGWQGGGKHRGAIRYEDFKVHIKAGHGGLPGMDFYNVMRDPGEKFGALYPGLFAVAPIQITLREHMRLIQKFPHRVSETTPKGAELTPHD